MWTKSALLCPLICLSLAQPVQDDKAKKDLAHMQGKWTMHTLEINGKDVPPAQIADTFLNVRDDIYRTIVKGKEQFGLRIKLDPSKNPRAIDMILNEGGVEKVYKGIYKLDNDTFVLCRGGSPEQERPNQFATWPNTNNFVVTWKRVGK